MPRRAHRPSQPPDDADLRGTVLRRPVFYHSVGEFLRQLPRVAQRFWLLVVLTGAVGGLGSVLLLRLLELVKLLAWPGGETYLGSVEGAPPLQRVLVPGLAGLLITGVSFFTHRPLGGHGTAGIIEAIWVQRGRLPLGRALLRGAISIVAVGMGASLGREGALVSTGAASGSWLADRLQVTRRQARLLVACGAASGIAAAYNVPIGGALFGLEVLLGSFALELLGPIVVSCVVATILSRILAGGHPGYVIPEYALMRPSEVFLGLACAPILALASVLYVRVMGWVEVKLYRLPKQVVRWLPPLGLSLLGAASIPFPQLLGNGYDTVNAALLGNLALPALLLLPALKLAATALCAGAGVPGGLFTPSLYYGALLGGGLGELIQRAFHSGPPVGAMALIGMAGVLAGTTHAAVSSVLIIFELTGDYGVILPLMLTATLAAAISRAIEPDSLYTAPLRRRGVKLPELPRPDWLQVTPVAGLVTDAAERVEPSVPFQQVLLKLLALPPGHDLYVTAPGGEFLGVIELEALKGTINEEANLSMIVAADVMDRTVRPLTPDMRLAAVAERFAESDLERLPVVDSHHRLVGTVSKRDLLKHGRF
ncbi:chloride channel protein [Anaeromyxobacter paludicola]|uniref:Voltage-gated chloride channel n=1 Tax=Anaeromyxobacter paludicola TaxID=2918171 RepID=A0ABN6N7K7_9BACT|nr:chloride channel protein [Anaeromyxobacter paludicola]BDG07927.1 voltage-gated chloride channel [Anaeromyxobacter paludicola]